MVRSPALSDVAEYAHAAVVPDGSRLVLTAGACPLDAEGRTVGVGDVAAQAYQVMANLRVALADAGADLHDVVRTTVYVASPDQADLGAAWAVVRDAFAPHDPPSTLVGVVVLGYPDQLVEVDAVAAVPAPEPSSPAGPAGALQHRAATVDDVEAVLALWALAAENEDRPADSRADVERLIARDPDALVLAVLDGAVVGTVVAGFDGWRCHLYRLAVGPAHRRRGVAAGLLAAAEERFVALGGSRADAMMLEGNDGAHHLWRAAGYAAQPRWRRWVKAVSADRSGS